MSSYHSSFSYLGQNLRDYNLIISHFDADVGEIETGLATESIYTRSSDGIRRSLYGVKYSDPEPLLITVLKQNGDEFSIDETRNILRWLTGANTDSWLDLYIGNEVKYRLLGHVQDIKQYKMDSRIVGFIITFESASPFAYSALQHYPAEEGTWHTIDGSENIIEIDNESDDLYSYVYLNTTFKNTTGSDPEIVNTLKIINTSIYDEVTDKYETTTVSNLLQNEIINISNSMMITSDNSVRTFGNTFNFVFPRLRPGKNIFNISGYGDIKFEYIYPIKVGDCINTMKSIQDPICDPDTGEVIIDTLSWSRISDKPTTLQGYGLKAEVDALLSSVEVNELSWSKISEKPTTLQEYGLKEEVNTLLSSVKVDTLPWNKISEKPTTLQQYGLEEEVNALISSVEIDELPWSRISEKPATLQEYGLKTEVDTLLSSVKVEIDATELDNMLTTVLS